MKTTAATLITTIGLFAGTAQAAHQIDEAALALQQQAAAVTQELRDHFRGVPEYRHMYQDAYEMYTLAEHIHDAAHNRDGLGHIQSDLEQLDLLFHHLEDTLADAQRASVPRPGGWNAHGSSFGSHGRGYGLGVHGTVNAYYWQRLARLVHQMGDTLHELQEIVAATAAPRGPIGRGIGGPRIVQPIQPVIVQPVPVPAPAQIPLYQDKKGRFSFSLVLP
jgi:hypothetical protein